MPPILRANACRAALAIGLLGGGGAARASCRAEPAIAPVLLQQYLTTPAALLYNGPQGIDGVRVAVQRLAPSGPEALKAILSTVSDASHAQQVAIGTGLASAASLCRSQDSAIVQRIINAVRSSGSSVVQQSFTASLENEAANDAASAPSSTVETHRLGAGLDRGSPQTLLPTDGTGVAKLPNPFGAPDEWR